MKTEYNGYRLLTTTRGHYALRDETGKKIVTCTTAQLEAIHILSGDMMGCSDENCPCYEAGRQKGLETDREPVGRRA